MALPSTNLWLQGRHAPVGTPRGVTAVRRLLDAGVVVGSGADNLRDPFCPAGRADPFETATLLALTAHLSPAVARIFAHTIRLPEEKRNPQIVEESRAEVARSLVALEERLSRSEFLSTQFGIADISLALTLSAAPMLGISFVDTPEVARWRTAVEARPSWKKVHG